MTPRRSMSSVKTPGSLSMVVQVAEPMPALVMAQKIGSRGVDPRRESSLGSKMTSRRKSAEPETPRRHQSGSRAVGERARSALSRGQAAAAGGGAPAEGESKAAGGGGALAAEANAERASALRGRCASRRAGGATGRMRGTRAAPCAVQEAGDGRWPPTRGASRRSLCKQTPARAKKPATLPGA